MVVSKVNYSLITVIDLNWTTITISRLLRSAILIFFDPYNAAFCVIVYLSCGAAITVTSVACTNSLIVDFVLGGVMGNTTEFSSSNDSSATSNSILLVNTELSHLFTDLIFAVGAILVQTLCLISCTAFYISALILLWSPVPITEMVSVT